MTVKTFTPEVLSTIFDSMALSGWPVRDDVREKVRADITGQRFITRQRGEDMLQDAFARAGFHAV